jgi:hypothetical protein
MSEQCIVDGCGFSVCHESKSYCRTHAVKELSAELTRLREENEELGKDVQRKRLRTLANMIWETRWVSDAEDYQRMVGIAAEIRSGNFGGIDAAMQTEKEPTNKK